jgi:hypothetical protein
MDTELHISHGRILLYRVFDVAQEVHLSIAERALRTSNTGGSGTDHAVARLRLERDREAVVFTDPPVSANLGDRRLMLHNLEWDVRVVAKAYVFGVMTIIWSLAIRPGTTLAELEQISVELEEPAMKTDLETWMTEDCDVAMAAMLPGLEKPHRRDRCDTLTLYGITGFTEAISGETLATHPRIPGLLLGERTTFSQQLRDELRRSSFSYSAQDLVVIGYDAALVYDPTGINDVSTLLEFALAQTLELALEDSDLDQRVAEMHDQLDERRRAGQSWRKSPYEALRRNLLSQHLDFSEVLERVTSAVKVTEDFYHAKVYREAVRVFRVDEIVAASNHKLDLMSRTYSMLSDEVDTHTSHRLERVVIGLILFEIFLTLFEKLT